MIKTMSAVKDFLKDEEGQSMVEYGITLGGVAAVSYLAIVVLGDKTADLYAWMANHMPGGEGEETGQVRLDRDGLVGTSQGADGEELFADRNASDVSENWTLFGTTGQASYYESGANGWNPD